MPPLAHNAALALRIVEDFERAKEVLDAAISQWPEEESLQFQRALIAYAENDTQTVIKILPPIPTNPEAIGLLADARISSADAEGALKLLDGIDLSQSSAFLELGFAATKIRAYLALEEREQAVQFAARLAKSDPENAAFATLYIRALRLVKGVEAAKEALPDVLPSVTETTPLSTRFELASEAQRMELHDVVLTLLKNRTATDRDNPALRMLLSSAINGNFPVAARELLNSISGKLRDQDWFLHAEAVLALNIGDDSADTKIGRYLKVQTTDLDMNSGSGCALAA